MNRTGIIVALSAALLLGVGGWYSRSWWWPAKTTVAKTEDKKEKPKTAPEKSPKRIIGESDPADSGTGAAQIDNRFDGRTAVKSSRYAVDEPLSSDEQETETEAAMPQRPRARYEVQSESEGAEEDVPTEDTEADAAATDEQVDPNAAADPSAEEGQSEEMNAEEQGAETEAATPEEPPTIEPESTDEEIAAPSRDTSRAPPLRSEVKEEELAQPETPEDEIVRIQEPPRAARALIAQNAPPTADEPTTKRSLKVARPLEQPPTLEQTPRETISDAPASRPSYDGGLPQRSIDEGGAELTSLLSRSLARPEEAPGDRRLEGEQSAPLTLTKSAPSEVSVGRPAVFETRVRNSGSSIAHQVLVMDRVPRGARLIDATPQYTETAEGLLIWDLGSLDPGQEALIKMQLMPEEEGEIGSVASASYQIKASSRSVSTRPQLEVEHTAPAKVLIGEEVLFKIRIHNPGSGVARGVRIEEDVPRGLSHYEGRQLEHDIGDIKPGETRVLELALTAADAGVVTNVVRVRGDGELEAEHSTEIEVLAPQLVTEISGPKRRYLDRDATYSLRVANPGTAAAKMVEFSAQLPTGFKFKSADNSGRYDARKHAVFWKIENLPAGQEGVVQLGVLSTTSGQQSIRAAARSASGLESASELAVVVEAAPETTFTVRDSSDPIEVGAESLYEIVVSNNGTRADSQVKIVANVPAEMQILDAQGPTAHVVDGQQVVFEPLGRLDPKSEVTYKIKVRALAAGTDPKVVKVQAMSDSLSTPVSREESTLIYEDR
jgi:hypothetical protein